MMTALLILAGVSLFVTFMTSLVMVAMTFTVARDQQTLLTLEQLNTNRITVIDARLQNIDRLLQSMALVLASTARLVRPAAPSYEGGGPSPMAPGMPGETYETEDGRHASTSFAELMYRVLNDPKYKTSRPEDISKLKDLFQQSTEDPRPLEEPPVPEAPPEDLDILEDFEDDLPTNNDEHDDGA